jgi:hypothetical protein
MVTLLTDMKETALPDARADGDRLWLSDADLESATGWSPRPEGLCRGDVCVPLPTAREFVRHGLIDVAAVWRYLSKPIVHSDDGNAWALGEAASDRAAALRSLQAPDFTLPDVAGQMHSLSDYRGKKVLLVSWASW